MGVLRGMPFVAVVLFMLPGAWSAETDSDPAGAPSVGSDAASIAEPAPSGGVGARVAVNTSGSAAHAFDIEVHASRPIELVAVRIREGKEVWGRYSLIVDPPQDTIEFRTASFRFLPASYVVEVEVDDGAEAETKTFGPLSNSVQKLIVVDRDAYPQRALLIEGDRWFLFGRLVASSEVSSGLSKHGGTPLGYYHVRNKEPNAYNAKEEWEMPLAQWYTPVDYPEGVNGLHQGFEGTIYGIRQSHGCTRMPEWFARKAYAWSDLDTPLFYIGNEYQTAYDRGRFDAGDYRFFQALTRDMLLYHQALLTREEAPTCFSREQADVVDRMQPYEEELLETAAQYRRFAKGEAFNALVAELTALRGE
ncbi:MAG: L,D-transpeptidase family protein [Candidatus Sumerlaeota bacterium]|nr:L,D-transpeptidase family protein [Candidatus Sumerlaeota bacterium]